MATILTQVDRTIGNYEDTFIYTLNASFNGVVGDINSAQIKIFFPDYLNVFLGDVRAPVKNVSETILPNGKEIIYDFGAITDLGIAVRLGFGVTFKTSALNGETYLSSQTMIVNGEEVTTYQSEVITLELTPQFELRREIVLPEADPSAGSAVFYKVTLENFGDLGAIIENIQIDCNGSDFVTIDTAFPVIGADNSTKFPDATADGLQPVFEENTLRFFIPTYKGQRYEFIYRAVISETLEVGTEVATIANWSIDEVPQDNELHEVTLAAPIFDASISIYAPDYSLASEYICYRMNINNVGNQILFNAIFKNELPPEINYYEFNTGSFYIGAIEQNLSAEYFIDYTTLNGVSGQIGPYNTDINTKVDLTELIAEGDNLSTLTWNLNTLGIGVQTRNTPQLLGIINSEVPLDTSVLNHIHLTFDGESGAVTEKVENATTLIANFCTLQPSISSSVNSNPVKPNDTVEFTFSANCRNSRLKNPIFAFLMPKEFEYLGSEQYIYNDIFTGRTPPTPPVRIIENFGDNGETLVKFSFINENEFSFRQLATIQIKFQARVVVGAIGSATSFLLLNTKGSTGIIPNTVDIYSDTKNIAEDSTVQRNYAKSNIITNRILFFVSTSSNKKVKGLLDSEFLEEPQVGKTVSGGTLEYLITVKNIGNANLDEVEVVDILPFIGDTGVIETKTPRNSEFPIYSLSEVVAVIVPEETAVEFDIFYSRSTDPVRFGGNFDVIGTDDDWTTEIPENLSELRAFKVRTKNVILKPTQTLKIGITATVPPNIPLNQISWNSFATDVVYTDLSGVKKHLLAVEPEKVGVEIVENDPETVKISGYSFLDNNGDGLFTQSDNLVNDVVVVLYDEGGSQVRFASTVTDASGNDGQYSFENLPVGKYYVRFFIDDKKLKFTRQVLEQTNGNKASSKGVTPLLDLTETKEMADINVGILPLGQYTLDEILKINNQVRGVLRDVIKNQMLLTMKQEDIIELIENDFTKE